MNQIDFIGGGAVIERKPFKDVRNTRPSAAEEKARLCLELLALCRTPPDRVRNGSVNLTRQWLAAQIKGKQTAAKARASAIELASLSKRYAHSRRLHEPSHQDRPPVEAAAQAVGNALGVP